MKTLPLAVLMVLLPFLVFPQTNTFSAGLSVDGSNVVTANVATGVPTGQTLTGSTSANSGMAYKATSATGVSSGADHVFKVGDNGAIEALRINYLGNVGIANSAPTHSLTLGSTSTGYADYRTSDQTTNYERFTGGWNGSTTYTLGTEAAGTGTARPIIIRGGGKSLTIGSTATTGQAHFNLASGVAGASGIGITGAYSSSSGVNAMLAVLQTANQTSTAGYRGLWISPYEQATGSGIKLLIDAGTNSAANGAGTHTSKFVVTNTGNTGIVNAAPPTRLSIGAVSAAMVTTSGTSAITHSGTNTFGAAFENTLGSGAGSGSFIGLFSNDGALMASGDRLGGLLFGGSQSSASLINAAGILSFAEGNWVASSSFPSALTFETTTNGSSTRNEKMRLTSSGSLAVGTASPHPSALLDVTSNSKGFLMPRMTSGQKDAIPAPAIGLLVYQTDGLEGVYARSNTGWDRVGGSTGPQWTTAGTDIFYSSGKVGIGNVANNFDFNKPGLSDYSLAVDGNIVSRKVRVTQQSDTWPDYVFDSTYQLPSLRSVEEFIKKNRHLPDVPSSGHVGSNGVDLGETQSILLRKVEELTLYVIALEKKLEAIRSGRASQ